MLLGTEVKSLRTGKGSIIESHASFDDGELLLHNCHIPEYSKASAFFNHNTRRPKKLLMHKGELKKLIGKIEMKGYTLVPLTIYFNAKNIAKIELALAKGKKQHDKRQAEKDKDWKREQARALKED
ncbi:MAG: smpB [Rickettsiales bacterium]|nr:smpB [Rickettsiales bacterium]